MKQHSQGQRFAPAAVAIACVIVTSLASPLAFGAASAEIVLLVGKGERRDNPRVSWLPAALKQKVAEGEFVRTLSDSQMALLLPDRTQVRLYQNSLMELKSLAESASWSESQLRLNAGRAWSQARPQTAAPGAAASDQQQRLRITTPTSVIGIRGTDWEVEVDPEGRTQVVVLSGQVDMSNEFGSVQIGKGEAARSEAGKAPVKFVLVNPKGRVQWVSSWLPQPRYWAGGDAQRLSGPIERIERGEFTAAIETLKPMAASDATASLLLADLLLHEGRNAEALAVLAPHAANPRATVMQASALARQDEVPRAQTLVAAALARSPNDVDLLLAEGDLAVLEGDTPLALSAFSRALAAQPASADAWYGIGLVESERENIRKARAALAESLKLRPGSTLAATELAAAETFAGNLATGRTLLQGVLEREPANYRAQTVLGLNELKAGRSNEALDDFLKAGVIEPRYARSWLYSGAAFYQQGEPKRALDAFQRAGELDPRDPMPYLYRSVVQADALDYGDAIASAREAQRRMPYLKSLNQAANNQKGNANLGSSLASFGMQEWASYYATEAYSPYWGGSHLFLADRYTNKFAKNSELMTGFLTDPLAFGASNRQSSLVSTPGHYGRVEVVADRSDWTQVAGIGTVNGMVAEPTPFAYFLSGDLARARAVDDPSTAHGRNFTLGLGMKPQYDLGVFLFATDTRLTATLETPVLTHDSMVQSESRVDAGLNFKLAAENQFWVKAGSGRQSNTVRGTIVSQATADTLNRAFATGSIRPVGILDGFTSGITQRDIQFRHAFTQGPVRWSWGVEHSRQERTGELAMSFAPIGIDVTQQYNVNATDAYLSALWRPAGALAAQVDLFHQSMTLRRADVSGLDVRLVPLQHFTLENAQDRQHPSEWNPRVGLNWTVAPLQTVKAVFQKWRRPASASALSPVDTVGVPLNDRLVNAGGAYRRARLQFDGELNEVTFAQAFADRERVDNGLGGRRSAISDFEVTQLESLRQRPDVFSPRADLEDTPQFAQGRVDSFGLAANHLLSRSQSIGARYVYRNAHQQGVAAGLAIPYVPRHYGLVSSQWTLPGRWLAGVHAIYRSERFKDADNLERLAAGWSAGATVSWESADKRNNVQAIVDNLLSRSDAGVSRHPHLVLRYAHNF